MTSKCFSIFIPPSRVISSTITGKTAGNRLQSIKRKNQRIRLQCLRQTRHILWRTNQAEGLKKNTFSASALLHQASQKTSQLTTSLTADTPTAMVGPISLRSPCPHGTPSSLLRRGGLKYEKNRQIVRLSLPRSILHGQQLQPDPPVLRTFPGQRTGRHRCRSLE